MRLINVQTHELQEFYGSRIPKYAILTHTWGSEEVSHQEWLSWLATGNPSVANKQGFEKIMGACKVANGDELNWLWVDTNCIDKASSAELTEAINSINSRWHRRGWTLQELLAPQSLVFYSQSWTMLGTKYSLSPYIAAATGIDELCLSESLGQERIRDASVAKKMAWLSRRKTTRVEDLAYCMLGLFDLHMPLLYGEGTRAFTRLQEEIIQSSNDHTIFCWHWNSKMPLDWVSMLAPSPYMFKESSCYVRRLTPWNVAPNSVTSLGLSISLPLVYTLVGVYGILDAGLLHDAPNKRSLIHLCRLNEASMVYQRCRYPRRPLAWNFDNATDWSRHGILVQSRPESRLRYLSTRPPGEIGVFFLIEPTVFHDFNATKPTHNLARVYQTLASPPEVFDITRNLLVLSPPSPESEDRLYTAFMAIKASEDGKGWYYLFFAATARNSIVHWYCSTTNTQQMPQQLLPKSNALEYSDEYRTEHDAAYDHMRAEAANEWNGHETQTRCQSGFDVTIGDDLDIYPYMRVRAVGLEFTPRNRPWEPSLSVPRWSTIASLREVED
ncbi:hypothetical protein PG989_005529 [Apiospora arundinis]